MYIQYIYLLADLGPGFLQPVDGTAVEGGGDLQHAVVVVEAAADVGHGHPLLNGVGPRAHVRVGHDLGRHQVAHLNTRVQQSCALGARASPQGFTTGLHHRASAVR